MKRLALLLASLLLVSVLSPAAAKDQLHLYNWNNYIAPETVKSHAKHILLKLAAQTRVEAVSRALSLGII